MEYNVDLLDGLDINQKNSLTIILDQIIPETKVLEFGPAYGRMTRFLKENLKCHVSCVERNSKTKLTLEKYAEKVLIENIEDYKWIVHFEEKTFDYIIFADVLEHLMDPEKALLMVMPLLKTDGIIFISIPNIAHNAVIKSLYFNKFSYQKWGILDKTHLRFFAQESLEKMIARCNLTIASRYATYYTNEMTGILDSAFKAPELEMLLEQRPLANVYQFVYGLRKKESKYKDCDDYIARNFERLVAKIYYDIGTGFSEENTIKRYFCKSDNIFLEFNVERPLWIQNLRIDPADFSCICKINELVIETAEIQDYKIDIRKLGSNALYQCDGIYFFDTQDPQIFVLDFNKDIVSIKMSMSLLCTNFEKNYLLNLIINFWKKEVYLLNTDIQSKQQYCQNEIIKLNYKISQLKNDCSIKDKEIAELNGAVSQLKSDCSIKNKEIRELNEMVNQLKNDCGVKDKEIAELDDAIERLKDDNEVKEKEIVNLNNEIGQIEYDNKVKEKEIVNLTDKIKHIQANFEQKEAIILGEVDKLASENRKQNLKIIELNDVLKVTEDKLDNLKENEKKLRFEKNLQLIKYFDAELKENQHS